MKFLVAYDSSATAKHALERTLGLLHRDRDSVLPELLLTEDTVQRITAARLNDAIRVMKSLSDLLTAEHEILDQAAACEADMIVMGSRGMGTIQGVSQRCLNEAKVPVMVVRQVVRPATVEVSPAAATSAVL
ncbi:universal stress domain containing protein [Acanthamoeba castellanii str. Neff]|uniref:Universal stress domain containing protein n=1 Tax=Acanthamoeba castellanii (strain ATCC 30010 / Neff) TaxID=1257118 RepID=L8GVJ5_ACACF|nr:universal stress domain containing protein [Acanthamoeba castellanii str. Neff]ELR16081.1 universal stress domain containing protein [Acanthamoeba castellanii str. Neff]